MRIVILLPLVVLSAGMATAAGGEMPDWAVAVFPSGEEFSLEIAADPQSRARGYMFREEVGQAEGMLFVFEGVGRHSIWMMNCEVALDIIWLDEQFRVVEIAHDRQPCLPDRPCPSIIPLKAARYVIEVVGGSAARQGLQPGDSVVVLMESAKP